MLIGYARTSTFEQDAGLEAQIRDLKAVSNLRVAVKLGCDKIYSEKVSSVSRRPQLEAALADLRPGDVFVVTKLDRLARSMKDLQSISERIKAAGADLLIIQMDLNTATANGKLMLNLVGSIAEWERDMMLERQREGIEKAKGEGKYKGRKPTARAKHHSVEELRGQGMGATEIAKRVGIGRASVYRILNGGGD